MTITTNLAPKRGGEEFSRRPATSKAETVLTLAAGAAISAFGILRRDWFGAAMAGGGGYLLYLDEAPAAYRTFRDKQDHCIKVVLDPFRDAKAA